MQGDEFANWMLFVDHAIDAVRERQLERRQDALWVRSKALSRALEDAARPLDATAKFHPLAPMLERQLKLVTAELEFLEKFRQEYGAMLARRGPEVRAQQASGPVAEQPNALRKA